MDLVMVMVEGKELAVGGALLFLWATKVGLKLHIRRYGVLGRVYMRPRAPRLLSQCVSKQKSLYFLTEMKRCRGDDG